MFTLIKLKAHDERGRIRELQTQQSETSELNLDDLQLEENWFYEENTIMYLPAKNLDAV